MITALEQCDKQEVELQFSDGLRKLTGYRWQDFATVSQSLNSWQIAHLPSAMCVGGWRFKDAEIAATAMIEISHLRNRWVEIPEIELEKLTSDIDTICKKHGGWLTLGPDRTPNASRNGYEENVIDRN